MINQSINQSIIVSGMKQTVVRWQR